ncbi:hypothetical protein [Hungatella hathewayi]|uniref:hypothetical protein n=1 Tax=Hungatella hathewayi TaxID=154046 RepID=UPI00356544A3
MKDDFLCKEVESANLWHLVYGIAYAITDIVIIAILVQTFMNKGFAAGLCVSLILVFLLGWCLIHTAMIKLYFKKEPFKIYYAPLSNVTDIDTLKRDYSIHMIDGNGILFTEKEDDEKYSSYCLMSDITVENIKESILAERVQSYED